METAHGLSLNIRLLVAYINSDVAFGVDMIASIECEHPQKSIPHRDSKIVNSIIEDHDARGKGPFSTVLVVLEAANRHDPLDAGRLNTPSAPMRCGHMREPELSLAACRGHKAPRTAVHTDSPCDSLTQRYRVQLAEASTYLPGPNQSDSTSKP